MKAVFTRLLLAVLVLVLFAACANSEDFGSVAPPTNAWWYLPDDSDQSIVLVDSSTELENEAAFSPYYYFRSYYTGSLSLTAADVGCLPLMEISRDDDCYCVGKTRYYDMTPAFKRYYDVYASNWGVNLDVLEPIARSEDGTLVCSSKDAKNAMAYLFLFPEANVDTCIWLAKDGLMDVSNTVVADYTAHVYGVEDSEDALDTEEDWASRLFELHTSQGGREVPLLLGSFETNTYVRYVYNEHPALYYDIYYVMRPQADNLFPHPYVLVFSKPKGDLVVYDITSS